MPPPPPPPPNYYRRRRRRRHYFRSAAAAILLRRRRHFGCWSLSRRPPRRCHFYLLFTEIAITISPAINAHYIGCLLISIEPLITINISLIVCWLFNYIVPPVTPPLISVVVHIVWCIWSINIICRRRRRQMPVIVIVAAAHW